MLPPTPWVSHILGTLFFFNAPAVRRPAVCAARPHLSMAPLATKPWAMAPQCATARLGRNTPLAPWCRVERWWGPQHGRDITRPHNLVCEHWITNNSYYCIVLYYYTVCIYIYIYMCVYNIYTYIYIYLCDSNIIHYPKFLRMSTPMDPARPTPRVRLVVLVSVPVL